MPWYNRVLCAINVAVPFLASTQATNLALLVSALLKKQTLCLSELARAYPIRRKRRVVAPKHSLLHRLKRLWRFVDNPRVDALAVQRYQVLRVCASLAGATMPDGQKFERWLTTPDAQDWFKSNSRGKDGENSGPS